MTQLSKDEFARWFISETTAIRMYIFDSFYDINRIMEENKKVYNEEHKKNNGTPTREPIYNIMYWFRRDTGSDIMTTADSSLYDTYFKNNIKAYKLKFCLNSDYLRGEEFCTIETIKTE